MVSVLNLLPLLSTALQVSYAAQASILNSGNSIAAGETAEGTVLAPALEIDLEDGTVNDLSQKNWTYQANGQLTKRRDTVACLNVAISLGNMFSSHAAAGAAWYVALRSDVPKEIKYRAEKHACGLVGHKSCKKGHKCIKYWYYATGKNCDTTAKEETIRGGLESAWNSYIHTAPDSVWCLKLTHGGTFAGHLLIGPNGDWGDVSCSGDNDGTCVSGGVNTHWNSH